MIGKKIKAHWGGGFGSTDQRNSQVWIVEDKIQGTYIIGNTSTKDLYLISNVETGEVEVISPDKIIQILM